MGIYSIVDSRADRSLYTISSELGKYFKITAHTYNKVELCNEKLGFQNLYTSHKIINKWMGRIYIFKIQGSMQGVYPQNATISLKYSGKIGRLTPTFHSRQAADIAHKFNQDKEMMAICQSIDFEKLEIRYDEKARAWQMEIWPNFGDYIWMLIPPVRYARKPQPQEVDQLYKMIKKMATYVKA